MALAREHLAVQEGRAAGAAGERDSLREQARMRREAMKAHAQAMIAAGIEPDLVASTMKDEQDAIRAIERRASDIDAFLAEGKQRSGVLDQVARLAEHMAGRLPQLDAAGHRLVVATLDLTGVLADPKDPRSPITITSRYGAASLAEIDLAPDGALSSTEV